MFITILLSIVTQSAGTPYITGGDSPAGTDCSGLVSWLANAATGRPVYGDRFSTANEESELLARGFQYGTAPNALVIGWNSHHTAATLPDGTSVESGGRDGRGVEINNDGGAYQAQFDHHMFLPDNLTKNGDTTGGLSPEAPSSAGNEGEQDG